MELHFAAALTDGSARIGFVVTTITVLESASSVQLTVAFRNPPTNAPFSVVGLLITLSAVTTDGTASMCMQIQHFFTVPITLNCMLYKSLHGN